jgi:hypothetical protein
MHIPRTHLSSSLPSPIFPPPSFRDCLHSQLCSSLGGFLVFLLCFSTSSWPIGIQCRGESGPNGLCELPLLFFQSNPCVTALPLGPPSIASSIWELGPNPTLAVLPLIPDL